MRLRQLLALGTICSGLMVLSACGDDNDAFSSTPVPTSPPAATDTVPPNVTNTPTVPSVATDTPTVPSGPTNTPTDSPTEGSETRTSTPTPTATSPSGENISFQCNVRTSYHCVGGSEAGRQCRPAAPTPDICAGGGSCEETEFFCKGGPMDRTPCSRPQRTATPDPCGPAGRCQNSELQICTALACPLVSRRATGIGIAGTCAKDGSGCDGAFSFFDAVDIPGIGFVCVRAVPPEEFICPTGSLNCTEGTGPGLDYDLIQDHAVRDDDNLGPCVTDGEATGREHCRQRCVDYCGSLGRMVSDYTCTGYCKAGAQIDQDCFCDSQTLTCTRENCSDPNPLLRGSCDGKDNQLEGDRHVCGCQCLGTGGAASRPGALNVQLGAQISVETGPPCNVGPVLLQLPPQCFPFTTEKATGILIDANNVVECPVGESPTCNQIPNRGIVGEQLTRNGVNIPCAQLEAGDTSTMNIAGVISFFDSTLGDVEVMLDFICE